MTFGQGQRMILTFDTHVASITQISSMSKTLVIITWLAYSCRNRMLRHCPTNNRIIGGKKKGKWPLFLWEFKSFGPSFATVKACTILAIVNFVANNQFMHWHRLYCKETPKNCRAYHFNHRINAPTGLSKIVIKIRKLMNDTYIWFLVTDLW